MTSQDPPPVASTSRFPSASAPASLSNLPTSFNSHQPHPHTGSPSARDSGESVEMDEDARTRVVELDEEAAGVEEENARSREKLVQVEEQLAALPELEELDDGDRPTPLELELARLETTLEYLSSYSSDDALSTRSPLLSSELALASIQSTVQELEAALKREYDKREEEEGRLGRDRQWVEDAELLEGVLERRVREAREAQEGEGGGRGDGEVLVLRSQARIQRLTAQFKRLQGALVQFIDERLVEAEPDSENGGAAGEEGEGGGRKKRKKGRGDEVFNLHAFIHALGPGEPAEKRAFELKKLIEALMNAAASTSPSSSASTSPLPTWLPLSSLTPPPPEELVRFLLRARIARENPRDAGEVRLEDFAVR